GALPSCQKLAGLQRSPIRPCGRCSILVFSTEQTSTLRPDGAWATAGRAPGAAGRPMAGRAPGPPPKEPPGSSSAPAPRAPAEPPTASPAHTAAPAAPGVLHRRWSSSRVTAATPVARRQPAASEGWSGEDADDGGRPTGGCHPLSILRAAVRDDR